MKKAINKRSALETAVEHANAIYNLLSLIKCEGELAPIDPNWGHVGSMIAAREALVTAAYHLGAITSEEAKAEHGVII